MATVPYNTDIDFLGVGTATGIKTPVLGSDAANKAYVDSAVEGLAWKDSVRVATQVNLNLAAPGASVDGITMVAGDRILVRAQTAGAENGIYIWNGAAVSATRSLDANTFDELEQAVVSVEEGTSASAGFRQTVANGTLGSTTVTFSSFGISAPAATETTSGIAEIATQAETDAGTDDVRFVTPLKLATYSGRAKRFAQTIGNASLTSIVISHGLGTDDVVVGLRETGGSQRKTECEVRHATPATGQLTLLFNVAPALNALRVTVTA
jgi:hypothetical protein